MHQNHPSAAKLLAGLLILSGLTYGQSITLPPSPSARSGATMAYDPSRGETILFGAGTDMWVWNGSAWAQRFPATLPSPRSGAPMAYDPIRNNIIMIGGTNPTQTWSWDGTTWTQLFPAHQPDPVGTPGLAFDPITQRIILMGGNLGGGVCSTTTWSWDGIDWAKLPAITPPNLCAPLMVTDEARSSILVVLPGFGAKTYTWDGVNWIQLPVTFTTGSPFSMIYNPKTKLTVMVAYSGIDSYTYTWDGTAWTLLSPKSSPPYSVGNATAPDSQGNSVQFGGYVIIPDAGAFITGTTWIWNGTSWKRKF